MNLPVCDFDGPTLLLFNDIPSLVYLSHIPIFIIAFLLGVIVLRGGYKNLQNWGFFCAMMAFGLWVFLDSVFWAANRPDIIMFVWSLIILIEPLVHIFILYLVYVSVTKNDLPFNQKLLALLIFLPQLLFVPTKYTLSSFVLSDCLPNEVSFAFYSYTIEVIFIFWIALFFIKKFRDIRDEKRRRELRYIATGSLLFLLSFTGGNIYGSITDNWTVGAIGLFGMTILAGFFAYSIVKFHTFNVKVIATQALVAGLIILVGSQLFFTLDIVNVLLVGITWILVTILGLVLIRSVKDEIARKEELQRIAHELEVANEELRKLDNVKTEFLSMASHQLRTPLTAMKGYLSMLIEGSYGEISETVKEILNKVYVVNTRLARLVEEFLNVSRIDAGRVQYNFEETRLEPILKELFDAFVLGAQERGLTLRLALPKQPLPKLPLDTLKVKEVISNLIDNALKYTKAGSVVIKAERKNDQVAVSVEDTGIGITPETMARLFEKFSRSKETAKMEVSGTGLGLYVGKKFVEAHGGTIRAESKGAGQGSRFVVTLPVSVSRKSGAR